MYYYSEYEMTESSQPWEHYLSLGTSPTTTTTTATNSPPPADSDSFLRRRNNNNTNTNNTFYTFYIDDGNNNNNNNNNTNNSDYHDFDHYYDQYQYYYNEQKESLFDDEDDDDGEDNNNNNDDDDDDDDIPILPDYNHTANISSSSLDTNSPPAHESGDIQLQTFRDNCMTATKFARHDLSSIDTATAIAIIDDYETNKRNNHRANNNNHESFHLCKFFLPALRKTNGCQQKAFDVLDIGKYNKRKAVHAQQCIHELSTILVGDHHPSNNNNNNNNKYTTSSLSSASCTIEMVTKSSSRTTAATKKQRSTRPSSPPLSPKSAIKQRSNSTSSSSSSTSSSCNSNDGNVDDGENCNDRKPLKRKVSFSKLKIRQYTSIALSDNPSCSSGPPIQLGWDYCNKTKVVDIDKYEEYRLQSHNKRKTRSQLKLPYHIRRYLLLMEGGYSTAEVTKAVKEIEKLKREHYEILSNSNNSNNNNSYSNSNATYNNNNNHNAMANNHEDDDDDDDDNDSVQGNTFRMNGQHPNDNNNNNNHDILTRIFLLWTVILTVLSKCNHTNKNKQQQQQKQEQQQR